MESFLQFLGIKPFKFSRLSRIGLALLTVVVIIGAIYFYISSWAQYGMQLSLSFNQTREINFNQCMVQEINSCVKNIIEKNKFTDLISASVVVSKADKFFDKQKSIMKEEPAIQALNYTINQLLKNTDISQHYALTKIKPLFGFTKKDLCIIQSGEKDFQLKFLNELSQRSSKERQETFNKYPANQELIHIFVQRQEIINKLYQDMEVAFPVSMLNKCKKSYAEAKKKLEKAKN